ncbi:Na(+)/H(+) antiporter subunit B [Magnetococcales bacterium HHB-1]
MINQFIIRVVAKLFIPFILVFAVYVQLHGDFGPGGGFQAGVIFASAFVLHTLVFGIKHTREVVPDHIIRWLLSAGVLLYAGVGVVSLLKGGNYLDYFVLLHDPVHGQHWGILLVELGVGITVAAAVISIFFTFVDQER